ncbi:hypothetical protein [uncultured Amnibacterium sp.]|uniref:hypothetical protein n=1 Tax=uncultured Amnibacterium sp. TaxID=1631851 RepID=UPI0035CB0E96
MEFAGFIAEDAPDPRDARLAMIEGLGIPVAGLVPQRHLEDRGEAGHSASRHRSGEGPEVLEQVTISRTYLLWRNPDDHEDPANLADLDDATVAALRAPLERAIPGWLHDARRMLRYPRLWEAVQTHWTRPGSERDSVADRLIAHAEYVLSNSFREQLGLGQGPDSWAPPIPPAALQPHPVVVDGAPRDGLLLDTDPLVLGLACDVEDRIVTVVVPRDELPFVTLELASAAPIRP